MIESGKKKKKKKKKKYSLDARLFFTVVLAVAPAVTMDEVSSLSIVGLSRWYLLKRRARAC